MKRRDFLKGIFGVAVVAAVSPSLGAFIPVEPVQVTIGQYADFYSMSDIAMATAIDPLVIQAAEQLAYRAARSVDKLVQEQLG